MDWGSVIGLTLALASVIMGQVIEGGEVSSLVQPSAFFVVFVGTFGAVLLQTKLSHFKVGLGMLRWVIFPPKTDKKEMIRRLVAWGNLARREGILSLESACNQEKDPFVKKGLRLMIDGTSAQRLQEVCNLDLDSFEANLRHAAKMWDAAGGYAPTIGILGAVLGLIHVMENLSAPNLLGQGIAVAFVATIYGVGLANLVFLPIAYKIRSHIQVEVTKREMIIDGLVCIANGDHPRLIQERLTSFDK